MYRLSEWYPCQPHTLGLGPEVWRVLALCHQRRNRGEYEGFLEVDNQLVRDLIEAAGVLEIAVAGLEQRGE